MASNVLSSTSNHSIALNIKRDDQLKASDLCCGAGSHEREKSGSAFESTLTSRFSGTFLIKHPNNGQTPLLFSLTAVLERAADSVSESAWAMCRGATDGTAGSSVRFSRR